MATLKTVQEVLCGLDTEKLIGTYRWHFPIGYEEHLELLDMTVREIQERVKQQEHHISGYQGETPCSCQDYGVR